MNTDSNRRAASGLKPRLVCTAVAACFATPVALALPVGPQVVVGSAAFSQQSGALTVTNTPGTVINWRGFSIGASEATRFIQQGPTSSVLNRVLGPESSAILGALQSNGRVWLVNPNGILFGPSARIDVQGLVASTLGISNADFLAGRLNFEAGAMAGGIRNEGTIQTRTGGNVYLVARDIENSGIVRSPQGEVMLAAGHKVSLVEAGNPDLQMVVSAPADRAVNLGKILVEGGRASLFGATLAQRGVVSASSAGTDAAGRIVFRATKEVTLAEGSTTSADGATGGTITVQSTEGTNLISGEVTARGTEGKGGTIQLLGERVGLVDHAGVDASGQTGGGTVLVGGDYQGRNAAIQNASATYVSPDASIAADAKQNGDGGRVIVWGNDVARVHGTISARGGAQGGDGGFVETSGHALDVAGVRVDAGAPHGASGQWLLDPADISVVHDAGAASAIYGGIFSPGGNSSVTDAAINATLYGGTNVSIQTSAGYGGAGDITFDATGGAVTISTSIARSLNVQADHDINFVGGATTFQSPGGSLNVFLTPAGRVTTAAGASVILSGTTIAWVDAGKTWQNSGTLTFTGPAAVRLGPSPSPSTFHNMAGGVVNVAGTAGWAFISNSGTQDGIITNDGTFNINAGTAFEAEYSQSSTGTLRIANETFLNLQNAISVHGAVNLNATGILNINENHGTPASLTDVTFSGSGGSLIVTGGKTVNLSHVTAGNVDLTVAAPGVVNVVNGSSRFNTATFSGGSLGSMNNGDLVIASGDFTVPAGVSYTGNVGYTAYGGLTVPGGATINSGGNIGLAAGTSLDISGSVVGMLGTTTLTAGSGGITEAPAGSIQVNSLKVVAPHGAVHLVGANNRVGTLAGASYGGFTYRQNSCCDGVTVGTAGGTSGVTNSGGGGVTLDGGEGLTVAQPIVSGGSAIHLTSGSFGGDLVVNAAVNAGVGSVSLQAVNGAIYGGGLITGTEKVDLYAYYGIGKIGAPMNTRTTVLNAVNNSDGDISVRNNFGTSGPLKLLRAQNWGESGHVRIENYGGLTLAASGDGGECCGTPAVFSPGSATLIAHSPLSINNIVHAQGNIILIADNDGPLAVNGPLTSAEGFIALEGGSIDINANLDAFGWSNPNFFAIQGIATAGDINISPLAHLFASVYGGGIGMQSLHGVVNFSTESFLTSPGVTVIIDQNPPVDQAAVDAAAVAAAAAEKAAAEAAAAKAAADAAAAKAAADAAAAKAAADAAAAKAAADAAGATDAASKAAAEAAAKAAAEAAAKAAAAQAAADAAAKAALDAAAAQLEADATARAERDALAATQAAAQAAQPKVVLATSPAPKSDEKDDDAKKKQETQTVTTQQGGTSNEKPKNYCNP